MPSVRLRGAQRGEGVGVRVVLVGATGNVGTSLLQALADEAAVDSILGVARRLAKTDWVDADIERDDLTKLFRGADAVVHLAWRIQPSHDLNALWRTNVLGSGRVFRAVAEAGVPALVYASSVGAYSPGPKDRLVDESWPTDGIATSFYARHKAEVERRLDAFEREHPEIRVARLRPALIFKREMGTAVKGLFTGRLVPHSLVSRRTIALVPDTPRLRFQAVHSLDVGEAYRLAVVGDARGPFNVAAEPVLDADELARVLGARPVPVPPRALRAAASASYRLRLQPSEPGWLDMGLAVPLMDTTRAREELGWKPSRGADEALLDLLAGMHERAGLDTPPLAADTGGPLRVRELLSGVGRRTGL
jgi:UDP-glucose 4-epimerase